ncbi:MAG: response regulator [Eubacteriales bacterium]|nr:response regulator [Eubacteriales bacterium]
MLKVLIADDEKKVCRLIQMLCDWKKLDMELVGAAYNGIQALEMIEKHEPDILLTDIRMPGYDGIEVIRHVREKGIYPEVVIISGYTDFTYAQSAIRYGVVDYLLKPIKKQELEETLLRLGAKCIHEKVRKEENNKLLQYMEDDLLRKRYGIFFEMLRNHSENEALKSDIRQLNEKYGYHFQQGLFRILVVKLDGKEKKKDAAVISNIQDGILEKVKESIADICYDLEVYRDNDVSYFVCNYDKEDSHRFRSSVRNAVDKILIKRFQLGNTLFSIGMGNAVEECGQLKVSLTGAQNAIKERLVEGCEKLLEAPVSEIQRDYADQISSFNYQCGKAIELLDTSMLHTCVGQFREAIEGEDTITGVELFNAVSSVGVHAMSSILKKDAGEEIALFLKECEDCYQPEQLFLLLEEKIEGLIENMKREHQDEERKPVRLAKQFIMNHYTEPITLEMVADQVGFSSSYFSNIFKKEAGIGFGDYLIQLRMEKAKELLKNTKENIKDICILVGYNDQKHFNATFRKYTGLKPGEFRKLYG